MTHTKTYPLQRTSPSEANGLGNYRQVGFDQQNHHLPKGSLRRRIIDVDQTLKEDRALFHGAQKLSLG